MDSLTQPILGAAELRQLAGLSYRQLNEWEKRGALLSLRKDGKGWRRVTPLQAVALRVVASLRDEFGIPLKELKRVLYWMLGYAPSAHEQMLLAIAEGRAFPSPLRKPKAAEVENVAAELLRVVQPDMDCESRESVVPVLAAKLAPGLVRRGWTTEAAEEFSRRFLALTVPEKYGVESLSEVLELLRMAGDADDEFAASATHLLGEALVPLWSMFSSMSTGFPTFLVLHGDSAIILTESELVELTRAGSFGNAWIAISITEHANAIFEAIGKETFPVKLRTSDATSELRGPQNVVAQEAVELLNREDVQRVVLEKGPRGPRLVYDRDVDVGDLGDIKHMLGQHDFQTVTIKLHGGKVTRVIQSPSTEPNASTD